MTNPYLTDLQPPNPYLDGLEEVPKPTPVAAIPPAPKPEPSKKSILDRFLSGVKQGIGEEVTNLFGGENNSGLNATGMQGTPGVGLFTQRASKDIAAETKANASIDNGMAGGIGKFAGNVAASLPFGMAAAELVAPVMNPLSEKLIGSVAKSAAGKLVGNRVASSALTKTGFSNIAMREAVEAGITSVPTEMVSGTIAEGLMHPQAFEDSKSAMRVVALSSIGGLFNVGFAYYSAIKRAANLAELQQLATQIKEVITPAPTAAPEISVADRQLPTAVEAAQGRTFDRELPNPGQLPTAREAAAARFEASLQAQIEARAAQLLDRSPTIPKDPIQSRLDRAAAQAEDIDPILRAQVQGVHDRLIEVSGGGGKGTQTGAGVDLGVQTTPNQFLTLQELQDHLNVLNMASVMSQPKFEKGQWIVVPRTQMMTAEEIASRATGGPIPAIDKTIQASMKDVQSRLDAAAALRNRTLDPEETQHIVQELLSMLKRLGRGFEVPRKAQTPLPGTPDPSVNRYVDGFDIPTSSRLDDPDIAAQVADDSHKRWVTGSDIETPTSPPPPPDVGQATATSYADAVNGMNIDYTPKLQSQWRRMVDFVKNAKTELYDRTWGVGKYSSAARDELSLLSGVSTFADDFYNKEMRIATLEPDGSYRGNTKIVEGAPLGQLLDGFKIDQIKEVDAYLKALTLKDQITKNKNFVSDVPMSTIDAVLQNAPQEVRQFALGFKRVADALVDDGVALGRFTAKRGDEMKASFYAGLSRSFNNQQVQKALLKRTGSMRSSLSPVMLMRDNIFKMLEANRKNHAFGQLVDAYNANPSAFDGVMQPSGLAAQMENVPGFKEIRDGLVADGMTHVEATDAAMLMSSGLDASDGSMVVYKDGRPTFWKVNKDIQRTMKALSPIEFGIFRSLMTTLTIPTRAGVSLGLDLSLIGPMADATLTAAKVPQFNPFIDPIRGAWHSMIRSEKFLERAAAGGAYGARFEPAETVVFKEGAASAIGKATKVLYTPLRIVQAIVRPLSDASRMGEYLVRREKLGQDAMTAALGSRRTLGDFQRVGASMRAWSMITEFGNVGIQTAGAAQQLLNDARKGAMSGNLAPLARLGTVGVVGITLPTLYFRALSADDPEVETRRKSDTGYRYWWWRTPVNIPGIAKEGEIMKIPKAGWWMGQAFGSTVEATLDGMDEAARKRLYDGIWSQVGINPIPLKAQQALGLLNNTSNPLGFENKIPITPQNQVGLNPSVQGSDRTSPLARMLADKAGVNPFVTDYMTNVIGGPNFSATVRMLGKTNVPMDKADLPVFGRYFSKPGAATEGSGWLYRDARDADEYEKSRDRALKAGDADKARKIMEGATVLNLVKPQLEAYSAKVATNNKLMYSIYMNPDISPEGKKEMLDNLKKYNEQLFSAYAQFRESVTKQ